MLETPLFFEEKLQKKAGGCDSPRTPTNAFRMVQLLAREQGIPHSYCIVTTTAKQGMIREWNYNLNAPRGAIHAARQFMTDRSIHATVRLQFMVVTVE